MQRKIATYFTQEIVYNFYPENNPTWRNPVRIELTNYTSLA